MSNIPIEEYERIIDDYKQAHLKVQQRIGVLQIIEHDLLHDYIEIARESGKSIREAASEIGVSKSNLARHWKKGGCSEVVPTFGSKLEYVSNYDHVWSHFGPKLAQLVVPFEWTIKEDGTVEIKRVLEGL